MKVSPGEPWNPDERANTILGAWGFNFNEVIRWDEIKIVEGGHKNQLYVGYGRLTDSNSDHQDYYICSRGSL